MKQYLAIPHTNYYFKAILGVMLILIFSFLNLKYGAINYSIHDILSAFSAKNASMSDINILQIRFPIVCIAIIAGAGLAISGFLLQQVTQNPLACPSLSGIEYGTAFSMIICYMFLPNATYYAMIIAVLLSFLTYLSIHILIKKTKVSLLGITLIGLAFNSLYYAAIQALLLAFPYQAQAILYDLNGSLHGITLLHIKFILLPFIILLALSFILAKRLDLLDLDEFQATALGISIQKFRLIVLAISISLATLITSIIGPLLFFGLVIPHLVRPFIRGKNSILLCAVFGSLFLLIAELLTKLIEPQTPPPVGVVMLLFVSPMLIFITRRYLSHEEN